MTNKRNLAQAAAQGDALGVQLALQAGEDPKTDGSHALRLAAGNGHAECVKLLIPVSDPLANRSYALRWAAQNGHATCLALLLPVSDLNIAQEIARLLSLSELNSVEEAASAAKESGHTEVVGMIASFMEAKALSESLSKLDRGKDERPPLKTRGLSL